MSLADNLETLFARPLTPEERSAVHRLENQFELAEDDPLNVVLAMMAKNQMLIDDLPERLRQKALEAIELHQQTLREQSTLIAKELIVSVANLVAESAVGRKLRIAWVGLAFTSGFIVGGLVVRFIFH